MANKGDCEIPGLLRSILEVMRSIEHRVANTEQHVKDIRKELQIKNSNQHPLLSVDISKSSATASTSSVALELDISTSASPSCIPQDNFLLDIGRNEQTSDATQGTRLPFYQYL